MHKILAGLAILGFSSTAALSCRMSADCSTAVDRDLVVASIATELQEPVTAEVTLLEDAVDEAAE